jgi:hypothetical protein
MGSLSDKHWQKGVGLTHNRTALIRLCHIFVQADNESHQLSAKPVPETLIPSVKWRSSPQFSTLARSLQNIKSRKSLLSKA